MQHYTINEEYNLDNQILKTMKYFKKKNILQHGFLCSF